MNRTFYRIVFNAARAQLMAVAEIAVARRRSTAGSTGHRPVAPRTVALGAALAIFGVVPPGVHAQIIAYRNAPGAQQATILAAGNGIALVNIQTPSTAGVSRNAFSQFDVPRNGAVLNNSRSATTTQLAGWVAGNPWLAHGSARLILNEVIAAQPSVLQGYVEVAGTAAQVVIANPSGITCSGCGFINAQRSTLTTGSPQLSAAGDLEGYRVERGTISIEGTGLDTSRVSYTDLIARAVSINAAIWANTLAVTTGANTVDAENTHAQASATPSAAPSWAIDVAALGGMYAGKITLVASEAGVGVHNAGNIAASAGDVIVTADGRLHNAGRITGTEQTRIVSGELDNSGTIYAQRETIVSANGRIDNSGTIAAQRATTISASGNDGIKGSATALFAAGVTAQGDLADSARLSLTADARIALHGQAIASGEQTLRAAVLDLSEARLSAETLTLNAASGDLDLRHATLSAAGKLSALVAQSLIHDQATSQARKLVLAARDISNVQGEIVQTGDDRLTIALSGNFNNRQGRLLSNSHDLRVAAQVIDNTDAVIVHAGAGAFDITADKLTASRGELVSNGRLTLAARQATLESANTTADSVRIDTTELSNRAGLITQTGRGETFINARAGFDNSHGVLTSHGPIRLFVGTLDNTSGRLIGDAGLTLLASGIDNSHGTIASAHADLLANSGEGRFTNDAGRIEAANSIALRSEEFGNAGGVILGRYVTIDNGTRAFDNTQGTLAADDAIAVRSGALFNIDGLIQSGGALSIDTHAQALSNAGRNSVIRAQGALGITAGKLDNAGGTISTRGDIALVTQALHNRSGKVVAGRQLTANAERNIDNNEGTLSADGDIILHASGIENSGGAIVSEHGQVSSDAAEALLDNRRGLLAADTMLTVRANGIDNRQGGIVAAHARLAIDAGSGALDNQGGSIAAAHNLALTGSGIDNTDGSIVGQDLFIDSHRQSLANTRGTLAARGTLELQSGILTNEDGLIQAGGVLTVDTHEQPMSNTDSGAQGGLIARGSLYLSTGDLNNANGRISAQGDVRIAGQSLRNPQGQISALATLQIDARRNVDNGNGLLVAGTRLSLHANGIDNRQGTIAAEGDQLVAEAGTGVFDNRLGLLAADGKLSLRAVGIANSRGTVASVHDRLVVDAGSGTLDNSSGRIEAAQSVVVSGDGVANAAGTIVGRTMAIDSHGAFVDNTRGTLATSDALDVRSGTLDNDGGLIQAGGALAIDTGGLALRNAYSGAHGGIVAQAMLNLKTGHLINIDGLIHGQDDVQLSASSVANARGSISALKSLLLDASQNLDNRHGMLAGGGLTEIHAHTVINAQGTIASQHDMLIADAGAGEFDNSAGRIEAAQSVALFGSGIANIAGTIVGHNVFLDSRRQIFANAGGTLAASGALDVRSGAMHNDTGLIQASAAISIDTHGQTLSNTDSGSRGGIITRGALNVNAGELINNGGMISGQSDLVLGIQSVRNTHGQISALGSLAIDASLGIDNQQGMLAADGKLSLRATGIDNRQGTIAALRERLVVDTGDGSLDNASGRIEAGESIALRASGINNTGGTIVGGDMFVDSRQKDFSNTRGTLAASGALGMHSGILDNEGGMIQSAGALAIDTNGQRLSNINTGASHGIVAQGPLAISAGDIDNNAGFIGAKAQLAIVGNSLANNSGGKLSSEQDIELSASRFDNGGGQLQAIASATARIHGTIDNRAGVMRTGEQLTIEAEHVINTGIIDAQSLDLSANVVDNQGGALRASRTLRITSGGLIDNSNGLISSADRLFIADPGAAAADEPTARTLAMRNTHGTLIADRQLAFDGATLGGDGTLLSHGDLSISVLTDFINTGDFAANGETALTSAGVISNRARMQSGKGLSIKSATLDNAADGQIVGTTIKLTASDDHTLTNRGLINGGETMIDSVTLNNLGSGRIYGDHLAIAATRLNNSAEAGSAPVIAARARLDIGAATISNSEQALIFSAGDLAIGGTLDANRYATGQAEKLDNTSATIEALGNMTISAGQIGNRNAHLETTVVALPSQQIVEYQGSGSATRHTPGTPGVYVYNDESDQLMTPEGKYESWLLYDYARNTNETQIVRSDPGKIIAAHAMRLTADTLANENSQIIAGATLTGHIGSLTNSETSGERMVSDTGTVTSYWRNHRKGRDDTGSSVAIYTPPPSVMSITLGTSVYRQDAAVAASASRPATLDITAVDRNAAGIDPVDAVVESKQAPASSTQLSAVDVEPVAPSARVSANAIQPIARITQSVPVGAASTAGASVSGTPVLATPTPALASGPAVQYVISGSVRQVARIVEVPLVAATSSAQSARFVRSITPDNRLPGNGLFRTLTPTPTSRFLVETDPQFTNQRQWLSSDYLLGQLGGVSATTQKRLGDGFYEQRLLREQIAQLTGQRFLAGYADDDAQYRALMDAATTHAARCQLIPGVALSAGQMAQLTADIVWLVEQNVTLPDGSNEKVLVPQIYALVRDGDLSAGGALIAANTIDLTVDNDLRNGATIAGRQLVALTAENIGNIGGRIDAQDLIVAARQDLANIGGILHAENRLIAVAGNDFTVTSTTRSQANGQGSRSAIDRVAGLYVSGTQGTLVATAGNDLTLIGARIENASATARTAADGATALRAGHNVNFATLSEKVSQNIVWDDQNTRRAAYRADVGSTLHSSGDILVQAGNDVDARAADIASERGALRILAGNDINIVAGEAASQVDEAHRHSEKGFLSRTTRSTRDTIDDTYSLASTLSAATTTLGSGRNMYVKGSNIVASADTTLFAGKDIAIEAAFETSQQTHLNEVSKSGLFSTGGVGFTIGKQLQSTEQTDTRTSAQASTLGSIAGNVIIASGNAYRQVGSDVVAAQGSVDIAGKTIDIIDARESWRSVVEAKARQSGLTVAVSNPVITAVQSVQQMRDATRATGDTRMQLLAAASSALAVKSAADAIRLGQTNGPATERLGGVDIGLSIGSASSQSTTTQTSDSAAVSRLVAGTDLRLTASGAFDASDLTLRGARVSAGRDITLAAEGRIAMLAAPNSAEQHSNSQGRSASIGVSLGTSGLLFNAGASGLRANADGIDTTWSESVIDAGRRLTLNSGGDTVLRGAQARADQIVADIGGQLAIESLQDTSTYSSQQRSSGFTLSLGVGRVSGSLSAARSTIDNNYASVAEQSGLQAGDSGFQIKVEGNTELAGGVITSSQAAVDDGRNVFSTGGTLTLSDMTNHAEYQGKGYGASLGQAVSFSGTLPPGGFGTGAGIGEASSSASSTSHAGISGIAGNTAVRSGGSSGGIANTFDAEKVQNDINAQVRITQMFGQQAYKVIDNYMRDKQAILQQQLKEATSASEKFAAQSRISELKLQERVLNLLIGAVTGTGGTALTKEALSAAADKMRRYMIEDSMKFAGIVDVNGNILNNLFPGKSVGIRDDGVGGAGTRIDLDLLCGSDNSRCAIQRHPDGTPILLDGKTVLATNEQGFVQFTAKDKNDMPLALEDFLKTDEGKKMAGPTGGIQGYKGTLFGVPYEANSWQDKLLEAFSGTHDFVGGTLSGLYDQQGNIKRGMTEAERVAYDKWAAAAILPSSPFAVAELLPPEIWQAISVLLGANK